MEAETYRLIGITFLCVLIIFTLIVIVVNKYTNPFYYPRIVIEIDLSKKRMPSYRDQIEKWIISNPTYDIIDEYRNMTDEWRQRCHGILDRTWLWKHEKIIKYRAMRDEVKGFDYKSIKINFFRYYAHGRIVCEHVEYLTVNEMLDIDNSLREIGYEASYKDYFSLNQRKLMTRELREKIEKRDNYTCQICGEYMPSGKGIEIDHIIAIKKGGKTVASNLQVLCQRCNRSKGAK